MPRKESPVPKTVSIRPSLIKRVTRFAIDGIPVDHLSFSDKLTILCELGLSRTDLHRVAKEMLTVLQDVDLSGVEGDLADWNSVVHNVGSK